MSLYKMPSNDDVHATIERKSGKKINQLNRRVVPAVSNAQHLSPQDVLADHR